MALGDPYATLADLKAYVRDIADTADDGVLTDALTSASRGIEKFCQRQFNNSAAASARRYRPAGPDVVCVDDFHTTTGLVVEVDSDGDGMFDTTVSAAGYELHPLDGVVDGESGWPFFQIRLVDETVILPRLRRASVRVTAQWGWSTVPAQVKQACLIVAAETYKLREAPFGVAGFGEYGVVRVRENPVVARKLAPYVRDAVLVA